MRLTPPYMDKQKNPESLLRLFVVTSSISVIVIIFLCFFSFYKVFSSFVISNAEDDAIKICRLLVQQQEPSLFRKIPGRGMELAIDGDFLYYLDQYIREFLGPFSILKVKIYDASYRVIYSTEPALIGKSDPDNLSLRNALAGKTESRLVRKGKLHGLAEENPPDFDMIVTYVPITDRNGKAVGCFETYVNISKYKNQITKGVAIVTIILVVVLDAVFLLSYFLIRRGVKQLKEVQLKLEMLAVTDVLTGLANRGHVMSYGEKAFARVRRHIDKSLPASALSCIMLDVDHFKVINDTKGHLAGDELLRELALRLRESVRPYDIIGRYGGEEFLVLLPDTNFEQCLVVADRIMATVRQPFLIGTEEIKVTVSLGLSCFSEKDRKLSDLLSRADAGLYRAKAAGRDQVAWVYHPVDAEKFI